MQTKNKKMKTKKYLWASPVHKPTEEQISELLAQGTVDYLKEVRPELANKLANCPADKAELNDMAQELLYLQKENRYILVQPGGSPAFQYQLGVRHSEKYPKGDCTGSILYAHSERVSVEVEQADGSVVKTSVFKHVKFF